jgi:large subunit ribosomal protein L21e
VQHADKNECDGLTAGSFSRDFKKKGMIPLSTYLKQYKVGDIVDVVANGTSAPA